MFNYFELKHKNTQKDRHKLLAYLCRTLVVHAHTPRDLLLLHS